MDYPYTNQLLYVKKNVINVLMRNANADPFKVPVNPEALQIPQYPKIIKEPMDFGTIKSKLEKRKYQNFEECRKDFYDVFKNCYIFNEPGSIYVDMALKLESLFKRKTIDLPYPEIFANEQSFSSKSSSKSKKSKSSGSTSISKSDNTSHVPINLQTPLSVTVPPPLYTSTPNLNSKRPRVPSNVSIDSQSIIEEPSIKKSKVSNIDMKTCRHIIQHLISKKYGDLNKYFLTPVDVEGLRLHDYYEIVKKPMDLGTVRSKLNDNRYQTNSEFADDVQLIFRNCYLYNPEGHEVRRCGKLLEDVFNKLYNNGFGVAPNSGYGNQLVTSNDSKTVSSSRSRKYAKSRLEAIEPLLQKIVTRQSDLDNIHREMLRQYQDIQTTMNSINRTQIINSLRLLDHPSYNLNNVTKSQFSSNNRKSRPSSSARSLSPVQNNNISRSKQSSSRHTISDDNISPRLLNDNSTATIVKSIDKIEEENEEEVEERVDDDSDEDNEKKDQETDDQDDEQYDKDNENLDKKSIISNKSNVDENKLNQLPQEAPIQPQADIKNIDNKPVAVEKTPQINDKDFKIDKPMKTTEQPTVTEPVVPVKVESKDKLKMFQTPRDQESIINEIHKWIPKLNKEMNMKIRELIHKMEKKTIIALNIRNLKPQTIKGLYGFLLKSKQYSDAVEKKLKPFSNEERLLLSHDLRKLSERDSTKILKIYKATEDIDSNDGECELDFQRMKLITLHRLREFADKCLTSGTDKLSAPRVNGDADDDDTDSDSSGSSESFVNSDSNSDPSSSSSSDNELFEENQPNSQSTISNRPSTTTPSTAPSNPSNNPTTTASSNFSQPTTSPKTPLNQPTVQKKSLPTQPSTTTTTKTTITNTTSKPTTTQASHRLSDSESDSDNSEEQSADHNDHKLSGSFISSSSSSLVKRPKYANLWNKPTDNNNATKRPFSSTNNTPTQALKSKSNFSNHHQSNSTKPTPVTTPNLSSTSNFTTQQQQQSSLTSSSATTAPHKLHESLKQIFQDAQAHQNVKKQEEELRQVRLREEEELKKQQMIKMHAYNESKKKQQSSEIQKKIHEQSRREERIKVDQKKRHLDIPAAAEREDYHQLLCDFEYYMDKDLLLRFIHSKPSNFNL